MKTVKMAVLSVLLSVGSLANAQDLDKGRAAYAEQDFQAALREWRPLAEQGQVAAQYNLGLMYRFGWGVRQDYQEAVKWYRLAAEQGHAQAHVELGHMYQFGSGVRQDYQEAVKWYRLAAEQGNPDAQNSLGWMYYKGKGVIQSFVYAHMWFNIAAALGDGRAALGRDIVVAQRMTAEQISQAQQLAKECVQKNYKNC